MSVKITPEMIHKGHGHHRVIRVANEVLQSLQGYESKLLNAFEMRIDGYLLELLRKENNTAVAYAIRDRLELMYDATFEVNFEHRKGVFFGTNIFLLLEPSWRQLATPITLPTSFSINGVECIFTEDGRLAEV